MNDAALVRERLVRQRLVGPPLRAPEDVVRALVAVQAQDEPGARWAVAQRTRCTSADVLAATEAGRILRTHVMRPTWHFVLPEDIRWLLTLTAPRVIHLMKSYDKKLALDDAAYAQTNAAITKALRSGHALTRTEIARALATHGISAAGQKLGHIMMRAELDQVVCSGPMKGKQSTYSLLDERAPVKSADRKRSRDDALAELATRWFATRAPASAHDFAWWSGLTIGDARKAILLAKVPARDDARFGSKLTKSARVGAALVHLLPNYDEYFVGYKDRSALYDGSFNSWGRGTLLDRHIVFVAGRIAGGWSARVDKASTTITVRLLRKLSRAERAALTMAAEAYGASIGARVSIRGA